MKIRRYLVGLAIALLGQGALAAQAAEEAELTWIFEANYTVDGVSHSCNETFANTAFGATVSHVTRSIAAVTVVVDIPGLKFQALDFQNFVGIFCSSKAGGSSDITGSGLSFFTSGSISGCPDEFGNPRIKGTYKANAEKISFGEGVAVATSVTGGVRIIVGDRTTHLAAVSSIPDGAEIIIFHDGEAEIVFNNGSTVILRAGNAFKLESAFDGCTSLEGCFALAVGKVRASFKCFKSLGRYCARIRTTAVAMAIRGTDFSVEHKQVGPPVGRTTVAVFSGSVDVIGNDGKITVVNAGEQVTIPTITALPWLELLLD